MPTAAAALRSALFGAWLAVSLLPFALLILLLSPLAGGRRLYGIAVAYLRLAVGGARVLCGVDFRVNGLDRLPPAGVQRPVILCPKHQSVWETFALPTLMSRPLAYVFKRELLWIPVFGWALGRLEMIHIDRSRRAEAWAKVAEQGRRLLAQGAWIVMFPEGTRTPRGSQGSYRSGAARLAVATGAALVPIAVTSGRCWPRRSLVLYPGVIEVSVGKPIGPAGRDPEDLMREVETWVEAEMRRLDPQAYGASAAPQARRVGAWPGSS